MMTDPWIALISFISIVTLIFIIWKSRLIRLLLRTREEREKTQIEDILKQLYHVEYSGRTAGLNAMSGALKISHSRLVKLIELMSSRNLIKNERETLLLAPDGRDYALKIIRVHRLWEKYLSERTGFDKREWHDLAEEKEHMLTGEQVDRLYKDLGSPRFDPHGDPIPTPTGDILHTNWKPLSGLEMGRLARIIHIEDEPEVIYRQILKNKLHIGAQIEVLSSDENSIQVKSEGATSELSPIVASNISVQDLTKGEIAENGSVRLSSLAPGQSAEIVGISSECRGANRRRLMDLGFTSGSSIRAEYESPMKEPKAYLIRNTLIALRNDQADLILIKK